jgi:hypothetical protein
VPDQRARTDRAEAEAMVIHSPTFHLSRLSEELFELIE